MKMQMYVIFDSKSEVYNKPFYQLNHQVARRTAYDLRHAKDTDINRHPADYSLFHIGEYDDTTAQIDLLAAPKVLLTFIEIPERSTREKAESDYASYKGPQHKTG